MSAAGVSKPMRDYMEGRITSAEYFAAVKALSQHHLKGRLMRRSSGVNLTKGAEQSDSS